MNEEQIEKLTELAQRIQASPLIPEEGYGDTLHVGFDDLPWVDLGNGSQFQLLHVDLAQGLWVTRNRMNPGVKVETHYHTGFVFAVTMKGHWYYEESPNQINKPGSYLFEPPLSVHTLKVSDDNPEPAEVCFIIMGSNINLDEDKNITSIVDAQRILNSYRQYCDILELDYSKLIITGENLHTGEKS